MSRVLPILFNGEMVQAILDGRKTVTRRLIKPQPKFKLCYTIAGKGNGTFGYPDKNVYKYWGEEFRLPDCISYEDMQFRWNPPYHADDILYVRETWSPVFVVPRRYLYKVECKEAENLPIKWHPSIHMPKEATRIWLKVKDVRVERLQEISEEQAKEEGAIDNRGFIHSPDNEYDSIHTAKEHFKQIWNSTIKKSDRDRYGWDANPWVWVIEFERCEKPENF